jgi:hypothetical protein
LKPGIFVLPSYARSCGNPDSLEQVGFGPSPEFGLPLKHNDFVPANTQFQCSVQPSEAAPNYDGVNRGITHWAVYEYDHLRCKEQLP